MREIPELQGLLAPQQLVRVPPEIDIPVTPRIMRLIDTAPFQRLARITQLGLVSRVYPGATHSRFEHSLGVYRNALLFLQRLNGLSEFRRLVSDEDVERLLVAGLLHDVGHWPFCHLVEDLGLELIVRHEEAARRFLESGEIAERLAKDWQVDGSSIAELLAPGDPAQPRYPLLGTILSGPIDIDKLDYLDRDSLHAGVPYGRNFDRHRLISQLCLGPDARSLAVTDKARTAAEMMVFARYVMFSEVYWHHAVRSATAMFQRAFWELATDPTLRDSSGSLPLEQWNSLDEATWIARMRGCSQGKPWSRLVESLFGDHRTLYKRLAEFHSLKTPDLHRALACRPYHELVTLSRRLAKAMSAEARCEIKETDILIDAPPPKLEVQFKLDVRQSDGSFIPLGEISSVAQALANHQFDKLVKRVRIFVAPELRDRLRSLDIAKLIEKAEAMV